MLSFRTAAVAVLVLGLFMGVAFGAGVAYGKGGTPKSSANVITTAQLQQLIGNASVGGGAGGGAGAATGGTGGGNAAAQAAARSTTGRITAVAGQTVTIETRTGSQKVNLATSATVSKETTGAVGDLKEGMTIAASGTRNADGSFDATSVSQVPTDLLSIVGAGAGTTGGSGPTGGTGGR